MAYEELFTDFLKPAPARFQSRFQRGRHRDPGLRGGIRGRAGWDI